jgi:zinc protease
VREKNGLVYSVYSNFMPFLENGPFQVGIQTSKDQIDQALNLVKVTVKDFIDNGPTDSELEAAKSNLIGGFPLRLESNKKIIQYVSMMAFYDYPLDYLDTFSDKVNAVTVNQIKDAYKKRMNIDDFTTVIVGIE